jgi:flavodoxin
MKTVIIYWSRYGNGEKIVKHLETTLKEKKAEVTVLKTADAYPAAMPKADLYVFSAPAEAFNLQKDMRSFMKKLQGMDGKIYGIINTHGMNRNWLGKMEKLLNKKNMEKVASVDFKVGKEANTGNGLTKGWEKKVEKFSETLVSSAK